VLGALVGTLVDASRLLSSGLTLAQSWFCTVPLLHLVSTAGAALCRLLCVLSPYCPLLGLVAYSIRYCGGVPIYLCSLSQRVPFLLLCMLVYICNVCSVIACK